VEAEGGAGFGFIAFFEGFEEVDPVGGVGGEGGVLGEEVFGAGEGPAGFLEVVDLGEDVGGGGGGAGVGGAGVAERQAVGRSFSIEPSWF
jgi:hypothetical protein